MGILKNNFIFPAWACNYEPHIELLQGHVPISKMKKMLKNYVADYI